MAIAGTLELQVRAQTQQAEAALRRVEATVSSTTARMARVSAGALRAFHIASIAAGDSSNRWVGAIANLGTAFAAGGVFGLALTAVTSAIGFFTAESKEAAEATKRWRSELESLDKQIRALDVEAELFGGTDLSGTERQIIERMAERQEVFERYRALAEQFPPGPQFERRAESVREELRRIDEVIARLERRSEIEKDIARQKKEQAAWEEAAKRMREDMLRLLDRGPMPLTSREAGMIGGARPAFDTDRQIREFEERAAKIHAEARLAREEEEALIPRWERDLRASLDRVAPHMVEGLADVITDGVVTGFENARDVGRSVLLSIANMLMVAGLRAGGAALGIPGLAEGGIVTRPTLAVIGEEGPEAVIPLTQTGTTLGGLTINIGGARSMENLVDELSKAVRTNPTIRRLFGR